MNTQQIATALRAEFDKRRDNPVALGKWLFDSIYWDKQEEIMQSVWQHKKTAVRSCNSGGKSRIAAEIALLYLLSFRPSRVITTAPTFTQVSEILWKEIHSLYAKSKIPFNGRLTETELDMGIYQKEHPWQMIGISTNEENRMQGFKSPYLLVILDEALGIDPIIWRAIEGLLPHRILAIGNPLDPVGDFFNCFSSGLWNTIHIDGYDCVRWQEEHGKIPGLITREWINERRDEWGENSSMFQARVLGEFPQDSDSAVIQRSWVEAARKIEPNFDEYDDKIESCDVASKHGKNKTVFTERTGDTIHRCTPFAELGIIGAYNRLSSNYAINKLNTIVFDADGLGEGLDEMMEAHHIPYLAFHGGHGYKATDERKFKNLRTQFYCMLAKKFEKGMISLSLLPQKEYEVLKNQLCALNYKPADALGRIQIETKDDLLARQIESPDSGDSVMMSEYGLWMGKMSDIGSYAYR